MGYVIQYGNRRIARKYPSRKRNRVNVRTVIYTITVILLCFSVYRNKSTLVEYLIPGNNDITLAAMDNLIENLEDGRDFSSSITVFCREILDNAQIPQ